MRESEEGGATVINPKRVNVFVTNRSAISVTIARKDLIATLRAYGVDIEKISDEEIVALDAGDTVMLEGAGGVMMWLTSAPVGGHVESECA